MKRLLLIFIVLGLVGVAVGSTVTDTGDDDTEIVLSDMPLTGLSKTAFNVEDEHQANDLGHVQLFVQAIRCDAEKL